MRGSNQNIQSEPRNTVNNQDAHIFYRCSHVSGRQGHNALESGLGWDDIANYGQWPSHPDESAHKRYSQKQQHNNFDINHTDHQAVGELADKQPN